MIMKNVLITGATGLVGGNVLQACLQSEEIGNVVSLLRRPSGIKHEKLREIIVDDFGEFTGKEDHFKNIDITYYCLAVYAGKVSKEKSKMMFARDKGAAENAVLRLQFPQTHIFRPGYIYPVVKRKEPNFTYRVVRLLYPLLRLVYPNGVVTSVHFGRAIFTVGLRGGNQTIYENKEIRKIKTL